ncbi:MAG: hypothetical protein US58_C0001G0015 [Candidatus Magasanikbacteria bacterium GW2011_GWA2_37_8]|uniref:Uncharacterized protein n=1 Tax=Candidatus Magasanikbacteria bacterium GW2011_GWA2_37_8 TaxID=1619036 RepID=A0A0G0KL82_9BACT|nr:MAG: hypothetical protein US58_C0001G0015 [Candidatus Magasanikbacteria bacterium GW2011_GWA2_37_8]
MILKIKNFLVSYKDLSLKPKYLLLVFVLACFLIIIRRMDLVFNAQFWAEDGTIWFAEIYNLGWWPTIFTPEAGYLQTISRLVGLMAQFLPLVYAPLFFNLAAVAIKALPVVYLFSNRWQKIIPNFWFKIIVALVYLFLPNTAEVHANITNAQWFLALLSLMILLGEVPVKKYLKVLDASILGIACISGPFSAFLLPIIFLAWFWLPQKRNVLNVIVVGLAGLVQVFFILAVGFSARSHMALGATFWLFVKIFSGQIVLGSLIGKVGFAYLYNRWLVWENWLGITIYLSAFVVGVVVISLTLWKAKKEVKLIVLFGLIVLLFSLLKPMASVTIPQWQVMVMPGAAGRYWLFPMLAFVFSLLYLVTQSQWPKIKILAVMVCVFWLWGLKVEGIYPAWPDLKFKENVKIFEQVPVGTEMKFKTMPESWYGMVLNKK